MNLIDTHCHLTHDLFKKDRDEVIGRAKTAGFKAILCSGTNPAVNREVLQLSKKYGIIKASLGIYPIDALGLAPDEIGMARHEGKIDIDEEFAFFNKNKDDIVSIGEVGLDYHWDKTHHKEQKTNFEKIISLTEKMKKPIVVHTRRAEEDCVSMLESSKIKHVILHSFEARKSLIKRAADKGFYFSVPTSVVRSQQFQTLVAIVPLTQIFTETDAPWLSPFKDPKNFPKEIFGSLGNGAFPRDKRNEPSFITESIKKIAEIKQLKPEEIAESIFSNYRSVFS